MSATMDRDATPSVHHYDEFIEGFAALMESRGVPRAAGRIFSYLQVAEPAEQTAAQISAALGVSLGTVSSMTRLLMNAGWVRRTTRRGERQAVYRAAEGTMTLAVDGVMEPIRRARTLTTRGLELMADRPEGARDRLRELNDVYLFF
jgi:DNA-binding transcriptional regulator GbsR (MarR family)